jgi:hypothetical protein
MRKLQLLIFWDIQDYTVQTSQLFWGHFSQWNSSIQNSWKLDAIWKSLQLLELILKPSLLYISQFLSIDSRVVIILVEWGLDPKFDHYWSKKFRKNKRTSNYIEDCNMQNHMEKKKKKKKSYNPTFYG